MDLAEADAVWTNDADAASRIKSRFVQRPAMAASKIKSGFAQVLCGVVDGLGEMRTHFDCCPRGEIWAKLGFCYPK